MEKNIDSSRLDNDPELKPLLGEGASMLSCLCFAHWVRGFSPTQIGLYFMISVEEVESNLALIKQLLPSEVLASQIEIRNEIIAIKARMQEPAQGALNDLSLPAETLLKRGQNPANVLKRFREEISAEVPSRIAALRKQNDLASIDEKVVDLAPEDLSRLVTALRREDERPAKRIMTESHVRHEPDPAFPKRNSPAEPDLDQKAGGDRTDRRITVRLNPDLHEKLQRYSNDLGIDLSSAVRTALSQFLDGDTLSKAAKSTEMPQEALSLAGRFQTMGSNLRFKTWEQFLCAIAASYVTSQRWRREEWVHRLHTGLLRLYRSVEVEDVRQI
jgi:hypothetical protein